MIKLLLDVKRRITPQVSRRSWAAGFAALLFALLPAFASADEGSVVLKFTGSDIWYLAGSFLLGLVALVFAFLLRHEVISQSPGSEKMREVGAAIKEGALAYLRKQVVTMGIFVVILAIALFALYQHQYHSVPLGAAIAGCFIGGVAASYIAGYTGMLMAVEANMRTAHAALTSTYSRTLRIAFRSGAVAGMVTVGMGLCGASLIFYFAQADAMKLLVGFGFGGSLAALFMRVGGGIFTKAADVGADLVGKVEAGIPEDDPRNPATIADNVGDNVGDCAGMAADIFESYEVTLVAAIILGAAASSIFDQASWMKLILFALMARGVGIVASIVGIYAVRGSDDIDSDPLKSIRKGFWLSAAIAAALTFGVAFYLMQGLRTTQLTDFDQVRRDTMAQMKKVHDDIVAKTTDPQRQILDFFNDPRIKGMGLTLDQQSFTIWQQISSYDESTLPPLQDASDFHPVDFNGKDKVLSYSIADPSAPPTKPVASTVLDAFSTGKAGSRTAVPLFVYHLRIPQPPPPAPKGQPQPPPQVRDVFAGPMTAAQLKELQTEQKGMTNVDADAEPATLYANSQGDMAVAFDEAKDFNGITAQVRLGLLGGGPTKGTKQQLQDVFDHKPSASTPPQVKTFTFTEKHEPVGWYWFAFSILFGILMAFAIEALTDYYVSTHKKPVREVAGVSTAGPAPMIIQGFALAAESSVFSVFAIVIALLTPLIFFPPSHYGGSYVLSFYGIALVGLGLLTTTGFILGMDTFGPISDNAQGVFEMSGAGHDSPAGSKAVQRLDAAGNTTKALTKGFAIATAVVAAVALFHSYLQDAHLVLSGIRLEMPQIFLGLLIGGAAPYLFAAFSINAVGRASFQLINEVRRQFRADAGIMAGTSKPNYGRCVAIVTEAAQKELLGPGILAIFLPILVAFGFSIGQDPVTIGGTSYNLIGAQALGGFLAGAILSGQLMAVLLANSGGMWDNAKKLIEDGLYGGKGSEAHKAGVVVDTVGDPFKDTAGPAMNPLIKVMNLVAVLLAPVIIIPYPLYVQISVSAGALILLAFSVWWSKRASFSSELNAATESASHTPLAYEEEEPVLPPRGKRRITVEDQEGAVVEAHAGTGEDSAHDEPPPEG